MSRDITYTFTETPETFARDYEASWLLFGQVFITNAGKDRTPIVVDPARVVVCKRDGESRRLSGTSVTFQSMAVTPPTTSTPPPAPVSDP